jgi:predicted ATPase
MVTESVIAALAGKRALLLLDNCEHLLEAVASLVRQLVERSPHLVVVCSSRERLGLRSERVFPVPPMTASDAEALFAERARAVEPGFVPDEHVLAICTELDDLPLAIELAAARVRSLSTAAIRERLAERLPLLASRDRDRDERQRTLEATIAWSYDLLAPEEQRVLRVLSVFAGGCSLEAAETLAGANLDRLESLLDKSLLRHRIDEAGEDRYWLLETIREYAGLRLRESGEAELARQAHRRYFLERAAAISGDGFTSHDGSEGPLFRADRANFRVVLLEALTSEDAATGLSLVASLAHIWHRAGEVADGYRLAQAALALAGGNERDRVRAEHLAGDMAVDLGETDEAARLLDQAEEAAVALDDLALLGDVQYTRSYLASKTDYTTAADLARLAAETARKSGSQAAEVRALQMELQFMRLAASDRDDVDRQALERCLALGEGLLARSRTLGNPLIEAFLHMQLAQILFALRRHHDALRHGQESLRLRATTRTSSQAMADVLIIGLICGRLEDHPTAVKLVTAALAAYESEGFPTDSEDDRNLKRLESHARQAIGNDAYNLAVAAGKALTIEQAAELALDYPQTDRSGGKKFPVPAAS